MAGDDEHAHRFDYARNANLVLSSERRKRNEHHGEEGNEIGSLWGHIDPSEFGAKAEREKPPTATRARGKSQPRGPISNYAPDVFSSSLSLNELATLKYRPRTQETRVIYEKMLKLIMDISEEESGEMGRGLLDEALIILCSPELREIEQRNALEGLLLRPMESLMFSQLLALSKRLVDWNATSFAPDAVDSGEMEEESFGLTIVEPDHLGLDDDGDDTINGQYLSELKEDFENGTGVPRPIEEGEIDLSLHQIQQSLEEQQRQQPPETAPIESSIPKIDIRDVDAHYLQRLLALPKEDAWISHSRAKAILALLQDRTLDGWILEGKILKELCRHHSHHENTFELLSLLMANRMVLVAGTALAEAGPFGGDGETKETILQGLIAEGPEGAALAALVDMPRISSTIPPPEPIPTEVPSSSLAPAISFSSSTSMASSATLASIAHNARDAQLLAARKLPLPPGSWRRAHAGYELIHVPAPTAIPTHVRDAPSLSITDVLPAWTHMAWENQPTLNRIQSAVLADAFFSSENLLVSAPTGAGKTGIAILALLRLFGTTLGRPLDFQLAETAIIEEASTDAIETGGRSMVAVYVAPMRALVSEVTATFRTRFLESGLCTPDELAISELTGESGGGLGVLLAEQGSVPCRLIVTTPEKWDIVSRKPAALMPDLLIVDEVHLIGDAPRGTALEAIIARSLGEARIVALSATLPNAEQVGSWLQARFHCFGDEWRPCPLSLSFYGIMERKASKRMAKMNEILLQEVIERLPQGPILVFVHSRRETARTARLLRDAATSRGLLALFQRNGGSDVGTGNSDGSVFVSSELGELVPAGIGIHHAGLSRQDRNMVENLFGSGQLSLLVSTATLAWGVNLPAHTVIIKGTEIYDPGAESGSGPSWTLLSSQDLLQMWGRAGRPQFDRHGEALLLTSHEHLARYVAVTAQPVLSQMLTTVATDVTMDVGSNITATASATSSSMLMRILPHLAAEVVRSTFVRTLDDACTWISDRLFLGQMVRDDPSALGIDSEKGTPREWIMTLASASMTLLHLLGLVEGAVMFSSSSLLYATPLGEIASFFYLAPATIRTILDDLRSQGGKMVISSTSSAYERVLSLLSRTVELSALSRIREEEQGALERLASSLPVPMERTYKAALLLQAVIGRMGLEDGPMAMDAAHVAAMAPRLLRAIFEIALMGAKTHHHHRGGRSGFFAIARAALLLARSVELRCWPTSSPVIQLLNDAPSSDLARLERRELNLAQLRLLTPGELAALVPQAIDLNVLPSIEITASAIPLTKEVLRVDVAIQRTESPSITFWLLLTDLEDEVILHHQKIVLQQDITTITIRVPISRPVPPAIIIHVLSDRFHHCDVALPISFRALQLPIDEDVPLQRIEQLAPVTLSQVRALYAAAAAAAAAAAVHDANDTNMIEADSIPPNYNHENDESSMVLNAAERHILWLLRLEPSIPLVVGLPFSLLADATAMTRLLEFGVGIAVANDASSMNKDFAAICSNEIKLKKRLIFATAPWRGRRLALGHIFQSLLAPGQLVWDEQHSLQSALVFLLGNAESPSSCLTTTMVVVGEVSFLFGLSRALKTATISFLFSIHMVMEWGMANDSQILYQELLLTEIHALENASVAMLLAPATLPSLQSLGQWVGASPGRLFRLSHGGRLQHPIIRSWRMDQNDKETSAFLPLLPLIEDALSNGNHHGGVLLCVPDDKTAMALGTALVHHIRRGRLPSLTMKTDELADLVGYMMTAPSINDKHFEWLAAGIAYAADPLGWTAFSRGMLPLLIAPLAMVGEVIASIGPFGLKRIMAWQTTVVMEDACMFGLGLAMEGGGGSTIPMSPVLFTCEGQSHSSMASSSPTWSFGEGESVLMSSLAMALPMSLLAPSSSNVEYEASLQTAMDYICQHSWLLERMRANPNFYHLPERSEVTFAERLSEALEQSLDINESMDDDDATRERAPAALVRVALHYGLSDELLRTIVWPNITPTTRAKSLLAILSRIAGVSVGCVERMYTSLRGMTSLLETHSGLVLLRAVIDICLLKTNNGASTGSYLQTALAAMDLIQALRQGCRSGRTNPIDLLQRQLDLTSNEVEQLMAGLPQLDEAPSLHELALLVREQREH